jgi:DNA-binding NarL/FixJ family response regulator
MTATVLIIEDHPLYRDAMRLVVSSVAEGVQAVPVPSAESALAMIGSLPDLALVLLDLNLPGLHGIDAIAALRQRHATVPIAVVSATEHRQEIAAVMRAGASAFIAKTVSTDVMTDALRRLLDGSMTEPEWIAPGGRETLGESEAPRLLTPRQQEILDCLSRGYSNKEIGLRLGVAEITVKFHVSAVFRILKVVNRTQAVQAGRRLGLAGEE